MGHVSELCLYSRIYIRKNCSNFRCLKVTYTRDHGNEMDRIRTERVSLPLNTAQSSRLLIVKSLDVATPSSYPIIYFSCIRNSPVSYSVSCRPTVERLFSSCTSCSRVLRSSRVVRRAHFFYILHSSLSLPTKFYLKMAQAQSSLKIVGEWKEKVCKYEIFYLIFAL